MRSAQNGKRTKSEGAIHAKMMNFCPEKHNIGERTKLERHKTGSSTVSASCNYFEIFSLPGERE